MKYWKKKSRRGKYARQRTNRFAARVKKVVMRAAETKTYRIEEENVQLYHNIGYSSTLPPVVTMSALPLLFNCWTYIPKGTGAHARIGNEIYPRGLAVRFWLSCKYDRPNCLFRVIVARAPKTVSNAIVTASSVDPFQGADLGGTGNKLLLNIDRDRGLKPYYDKIVRIPAGQKNTFVDSAKEQHTYLKLWIKRKRANKIIYDDVQQIIVNNPLLVWVIPYEQYSTLVTDNVASLSYSATLYYKDV